MGMPAKLIFSAFLAILFAGAFLHIPAETEPPNALAFEIQAKQVAADYLKDSFCQCGDSYYRAIRVGGSVVIDQFKATRGLIVHPEPLSGLERSGGIDWKGMAVLFEFGSMRQYRRSRWSEWEKAPLLRAVTETLTRKNGRWVIDSETDRKTGTASANLALRETVLPLNCAQVAFLSDLEDNLMAQIPSTRGFRSSLRPVG